jgi:hypothetical protein
MHRSRLCGFIIDCSGDDLEGAAAFWSGALGFDLKASDDPADANYRLLRTAPDDPHIEVQRVAHPSGVHLDIEADDVEAEVERLERLGARRVRKVRTWWVMEAPTGQRFCVVRAATPDFARKANAWK